jgi:hypothetical protein
MDEIEAMEFILEKMKATKNNLDFFDMMREAAERRHPAIIIGFSESAPDFAVWLPAHEGLP